MNVAQEIAASLSLPRPGVEAALALFDEGATIPFVARYRKERTGSLDEVALRDIEERARYLADLVARRDTVLSAIAEQGKLSPELRRAIEACRERAALEDLYAPYKKRRATRADKARAKGLEPLARAILEQPAGGDPRRDAEALKRRLGLPDSVDDVLAGARDIVAEDVSNRADLRAWLRTTMERHGDVVAKVADESHADAARFERYFDFREPAARIPSHRYLAVCRGEREGVLRVRLDLDKDRAGDRILERLRVRRGSRWGEQLDEAVRDGLKRLLYPQTETAVRAALTERADAAAIEVFAANLQELLLAAPLGPKAVLGVDPGLRTGCKCALVDDRGALVEHTAIHLIERSGLSDRGMRELTALIRRARPDAIAVGNGTGGREALDAARKAAADVSDAIVVVSVNEAGASVYSASDIARAELPDVDLTVRGAVSIARRLQDPLAELIKIDPKSIGVGQYQHDVDQPALARKLDAVVETSVNRVGADLGTASAELLKAISGIGPTLAQKIVAHREARGRFRSRRDLLDVPGLGPRTFELCAGFLRILDGREPLDASAVHPERYDLVRRMARDLGVSVADLVGDASLAARIDPRRYVGDDVGEPTLRDILAELAKPGRDPRSEFEAPAFSADVSEIEHLTPGMVLEGVVTNVTDFGAFVDVGVHQDGLVHVSKLADRFVRDPHAVVRVGQRLEVTVLDVDVRRKRISLSAASSDRPAEV